jgi:rhodanese-related sulfurtransferase
MSQEIINLELKLRIDQCLSLIPPDYYAIANIEALKSQLEKTETLLVDVRETSEYQLGHIPNAINIPLRTLVSNVEKIPRDRPVVLYCSTGYRAAMGVLTLHLLGYDNIQGFPPGFVTWKNAEEMITH